MLKGKNHGQKLVIKKRLPQGTTKVTIKGKALRPDTYVLTGTAKNSSGTSAKKKTQLVVRR